MDYIKKGIIFSAGILGLGIAITKGLEVLLK